MKQPIISDLEYVTKDMIDALETWLENIKNGNWLAGETCPFRNYELNVTCSDSCMRLFDNKPPSDGKAYCPCYDCNFGQEATILAFTIICDVWTVYHVKP